MQHIPMTTKIAIFLVCALLTGCFLFKGSGGVTGSEARSLVESGAQLVDVRTPNEFNNGHIPGAVNIPVQELESRMGELQSKNQPIVLYCRSGVRSSRAASMLKSAGYTEVHDLGPMSRW